MKFLASRYSMPAATCVATYINTTSSTSTLDIQIDRQIDRQIDGQMDRWIDGQMNRQMDIDRQIEIESRLLQKPISYFIKSQKLARIQGFISFIKTLGDFDVFFSYMFYRMKIEMSTPKPENSRIFTIFTCFCTFYVTF